MGELTIKHARINRINTLQIRSFFAKFRGESSVFVRSLSRARFEWCLVAFGAGVAAYFGWSVEPNLLPAFAISLILYALLFVVRTRPATRELILLALFLSAGFTRAVHHTQSAEAPILPEFRRAYTFTGWIEDIQSSGKLQHFYVRVQSAERLKPEQTPKRVRVRIKPYGFKPGDSVRFKALMAAPPGPAIVGGYDSARAAYYKRIGGYGFAISKPQTVELDKLPIGQRAKRKLVKFRYALSRRIQARAPPRTAGLQAALLTGDRSGIPPEQSDALRHAGLAHLLAISGLHMGLLAGGAYFMASLFFASIGPLARRYDMRKWAAVVGIIVATTYLLISGASVSTQRAFIMAVIVFIAVIFDRRAVSMRSVALAAALTLMLHPESLLSAGFQMSFSATAALVAVYRNWADHREFTPRGNILQRIWNGFIGISVTSFVAGLATGGFAALHFHRFARLGFIANLLAMPVFTMVVMPAGFLAVLLIPFGLDKAPLWVMGTGLDYVVAVATWVSSMKWALVYIKGANAAVISLFSLGFICLCLGPNKVRAVGAAAILLSCIFWAGIDRPDMRISAEARIAFWDPDEVDVLRVDRKRGDGFGRARFVEQAGLKTAEKRSYMDSESLCDMLGCRINIKGKIISIVHEPEGVAKACADSDLVILTAREAGPRARRACKTPLIDVLILTKSGAQDVYIKKGGLEVRTANPKKRRARPWG